MARKPTSGPLPPRLVCFNDGGGPAAPTRRAVRRRHWSLGEKLRLVRETLLPGATLSSVARSHGICVTMLFRWRKRLTGEAETEACPRAGLQRDAEMRGLRKRIRELELALARLRRENEILRSLVFGRAKAC